MLLLHLLMDYGARSQAGARICLSKIQTSYIIIQVSRNLSSKTAEFFILSCYEDYFQ